MKIVIPGGSGQVGHILARHFNSQGHDVTVLSREPEPAPWTVLPWDGETAGAWINTLSHADVCLNLSGRSVNCRYTRANRRAIMDSRVLSTRILNQVIASLDHPPALWLNASTATIYRHALDRDMDEFTGEFGGGEVGAPDTWRFSIQVAKAWEEAFFATPTPRTRKVALRSAMTLSPDAGGVFDVLLGLVRHGLGGTVMPGTQYISWIHETDFIRSIEFLIEHAGIEGPVNLASPNPIANREFLRILREQWGTRIGLSSAEWMTELGTFFLRTESELILKSRRVVPGRMLDAGFEFTYPSWTEAAAELVGRRRRTTAKAA